MVPEDDNIIVVEPEENQLLVPAKDNTFVVDGRS